MPDAPPTVRTPTEAEAAEFRLLGLTPGHWAALAVAPLFRADLRTPTPGDFPSLHPLRVFLRTLPGLVLEAEEFWIRLGAKEIDADGLEVAYALLGWHLANDLTRERREAFLGLLDRTAQQRRLRPDRPVPIERDVRRWSDAYHAVASYSRRPPLARVEPPDLAEVLPLLGPGLWKQLLTAPIAAALIEREADTDAAFGVVCRLAAVSEPDPFVTPHPLEPHLTPAWMRLFGPLANPTYPPSPPLEDAMRVVARGLATLEFDEREKIFAAIGQEIRQAVPGSDRDAYATEWVDRLRAWVEDVLRGCRLVAPPPEPVLAKLVVRGDAIPPPPPPGPRVWLCGFCGIENPPGERRCVACGSVSVPPLVLRSAATGREEEVRTNRRLGRAVFAGRLGDPDARFASELQFEVIRDETAAAWVVRPLPGAMNPTYYNGKPLAPDGSRLDDGGVISIGKTKLKLQVRLAL